MSEADLYIYVAVARRAERAERPRISENAARIVAIAMMITILSHELAVLVPNIPSLLLKSCGTLLLRPIPQTMVATSISAIERVARREGSTANRRTFSEISLRATAKQTAPVLAI